jgi:hypothetical protein
MMPIFPAGRQDRQSALGFRLHCQAAKAVTLFPGWLETGGQSLDPDATWPGSGFCS